MIDGLMQINNYPLGGTFVSSLIPKGSVPLDRRSVVSSFDNLFKYSSWIFESSDGCLYTLHPGLKVWVEDKKQSYIYMGLPLNDSSCTLVKDAVIDDEDSTTVEWPIFPLTGENTEAKALERAKARLNWIPQAGFLGVFPNNGSLPNISQEHLGDGWIAGVIDGSKTSFKITVNGAWVELGSSFDASEAIADIKRELGTVYTYKGSYDYLTDEHKASDPAAQEGDTVAQTQGNTFAIGDVVNITKAGPNFPAGTNFAYAEKEAEIPVDEWQGGTSTPGDPGTNEYPRWKDSNHTVVLNLVPEWDSLGGNFNPGQIKADVTESIAGGTVDGNSVVNTTVYKDGDTGYNTYVTNNTFEAPSGFTGSGDGPYTKTDGDVTTTITVTQDPTTEKLVVTVTETHVLHDCTSNNSDGLDGITLVNINAELGHLDARVSALETTVSGHTEAIGTLNGNVTTLTGDVGRERVVYANVAEYNAATNSDLDEEAFAALTIDQKTKITGSGLKFKVQKLEAGLTWG